MTVLIAVYIMNTKTVIVQWIARELPVATVSFTVMNAKPIGKAFMFSGDLAEIYQIIMFLN